MYMPNYGGQYKYRHGGSDTVVSSRGAPRGEPVTVRMFEQQGFPPTTTPGVRHNTPPHSVARFPPGLTLLPRSSLSCLRTDPPPLPAYRPFSLAGLPPRQSPRSQVRWHPTHIHVAILNQANTFISRSFCHV